MFTSIFGFLLVAAFCVIVSGMVFWNTYGLTTFTWVTGGLAALYFFTCAFSASGIEGTQRDTALGLSGVILFLAAGFFFLLDRMVKNWPEQQSEDENTMASH